jgi:hypothetical protein
MPASSVRRAALVRAWTHHHEEDTADRRVYKPSDVPVPPARGRDHFELVGDGSVVTTGPGADDRPMGGTGRWELKGRRLALYLRDGPPDLYDIDTVGPARLVLRPVTTDERKGPGDG